MKNLAQNAAKKKEGVVSAAWLSVKMPRHSRPLAPHGSNCCASQTLKDAISKPYIAAETMPRFHTSPLLIHMKTVNFMHTAMTNCKL